MTNSHKSRLCAVLGIALFMFLSSCSSKKVLTYFQDVDTSAVVPVGEYNVKIQPSDELAITVYSSVPEAAAPYNLPVGMTASVTELTRSTPQKLQTYVVDARGDIRFPVLGKIHAAGMTTEQLAEYIALRAETDLIDPVVRVELVNFVVNVAGDVARPGRVPVTSHRFSVLDAITAAGDLTPYGRRDNVLLVREEDGKRMSARLDLNDPATLSSPYFFVHQNDYIYVEPSKVRSDNAEYNQNNSYKLSLTSTIVSACSVLTSLIIALTR